MRTRFVKFGAAAKEYCGGDAEALTEAVFLARTTALCYARLAPTKCRVAPPGNWKIPSAEGFQSFQEMLVQGWHPLPQGRASTVLTRGSGFVSRVVYRDQSIQCDGAGEALSFFAVPYSLARDRAAWLLKEVSIQREEIWFSRKQIERSIASHYGSAETAKPLGWPWGGHETGLLRHLGAAADRFWKNYDPAEPDTAPTNKAVSAWLVDRGVSQRTAEYIATILRADGLPSGPRK